MNAYVLLFCAHFAFVFLKAFQNRNVIFDRFWPIMPVSFGMSFMDVYVITSLAATGFNLGSVIALGSAGGAGAVLAMVVHKKAFSND